MRKVIEYMVVVNDCHLGFQDEIKDLLSYGWQPYGDLLITSGIEKTTKNTENFFEWFYQPMVKYEGSE